MAGDFTIDGSAFAYLEDRVRSLLGKDQVALEWHHKLKQQLRVSLERASWIQFIGLDHPVPIGDIYQPTVLIQSAPSAAARATDARTLVKQNYDAVIFGGPGRGKTTLLHWLFIHLANESKKTPLLVTLRSPGAVEDLSELVGHFTFRKRSGNAAEGIVLLVDGYDEVSESDRKSISESLLRFRAGKAGRFYLTCREFYSVYNLPTHAFHISPFSVSDAEAFVTAFSRIFGVAIESHALLKELTQHGLSDFAFHPLMLALVCILKTGPNAAIPRNSVGVIRRAIDALTFRWDYAKGVHRDSALPIDGEERVRCLMRVAHKMKSPAESDEVVESAVREHLRLAQQPKIDVRTLLVEMAQWYGLLVPSAPGYWEFAHRTVQDFLAARFVVESGKFDPRAVEQWGLQEAYCACLVSDATQTLVLAFRHASELFAFSECLYNGALFDGKQVADALLGRLESRREFTYATDADRVVIHTAFEFFSYAKDDFLRILLVIGTQRRSPGRDLLAGFSMATLMDRRASIDRSLLHAVKICYGNAAFSFTLESSSHKRNFTVKHFLTVVGVSDRK